MDYFSELKNETGLPAKGLKEIAWSLKFRNAELAVNKLLSILIIGLDNRQILMLSKAIAKIDLGDEKLILHLNMRNYKEIPDARYLFDSGVVPGYINEKSDNATNLLLEVRRNKKVVIFFENFDKAHYLIREHVLFLLDEGKLWGRHGEIIDFSNCIVIFSVSKEQEKILIKEFSEKGNFFQLDWSKLNLPHEILARIRLRSIFDFNEQ